MRAHNRLNNPISRFADDLIDRLLNLEKAVEKYPEGADFVKGLARARYIVTKRRTKWREYMEEK